MNTGEREIGPNPGFLRTARALYIDGVTAEVVAAMDGAGIPAILLKGPSIARWLYPTGGRTYADTDILVPPSEFARAASVLRAQGFTEMLEGFHPHERDADSAEMPFIRFPVPGGRSGGKVDLHRNLPQLPTPDNLLWEMLSAGCETMRVGGIDVRVLNRTGVALHVVVHAVQHGFDLHTDEDLRRVLDALPRDGWGEVAALAKRLGIEEVIGLGLRRHPAGAGIADRLVLPDPVLADSEYVWSFPHAPRGAQSLSLICSAPSVREKARVVRWKVFPSRAKVRYESELSPAVVRSVAVRYLRYWRMVATAMPGALRFVVDDRRRRQARGDDSPPRSSWSDRWLLLEAGICLAWTRAGLLLVPFRWITRALGQRLGETPTADDPTAFLQRQRVASAIQRISRHTPWTSTCLAQALAGKQMLLRRGITSTLYLGVAKDAKADLKAHAWLRSGSVLLTGGDDLERLTVIASFAGSPSKRGVLTSNEEHEAR